MKSPESKKVVALDERFLNWIERYRIIIGAALVLVVVSGAITLSIINAKPKVVEKPIIDTAAEEELAALREQNNLLRKQIEEINQTRVAGATTKTPISKSQIINKSQSSNTQKDSKTISGLININTANQSALESLPKIGPTIAQRIIEYRNTNGAFKNTADIKNVKGIGDKTFEQIRDKITVE